MKTNIHFLSYLPHLFLEWEMFQAEFSEKIIAHILHSTTFFLKVMPFMRYVEKYSRDRQATDYNMAHAYFMLPT
jgi:hypothetical protein